MYYSESKEHNIKIGDIVVAIDDDKYIRLRKGDVYEVLEITPAYETGWGEVVPEFYVVRDVSTRREDRYRAWHFRKKEDKWQK